VGCETSQASENYVSDLRIKFSRRKSEFYQKGLDLREKLHIPINNFHVEKEDLNCPLSNILILQTHILLANIYSNVYNTYKL
jgi:hypothetical protein